MSPALTDSSGSATNSQVPFENGAKISSKNSGFTASIAQSALGSLNSNVLVLPLTLELEVAIKSGQ
jgi:hypothetical protein